MLTEYKFIYNAQQSGKFIFIMFLKNSIFVYFDTMEDLFALTPLSLKQCEPKTNKILAKSFWRLIIEYR